MWESRFGKCMCVRFSECWCVGCMQACRLCKIRCFGGMQTSNMCKRSLLLFFGSYSKIPLQLVGSFSRYIYIYTYIRLFCPWRPRKRYSWKKNTHTTAALQGYQFTALHVLAFFPTSFSSLVLPQPEIRFLLTELHRFCERFSLNVNRDPLLNPSIIPTSIMGIYT